MNRRRSSSYKLPVKDLPAPEDLLKDFITSIDLLKLPEDFIVAIEDLLKVFCL